MTVAFVTASISRKAGGLYESVRRLAQSMSGPTMQVQAFALEDDETGKDRGSWDPVGVRVFKVIGPRRFGFAPRMGGALVRSGAQLAMVHGLWMYPSVATNIWHARTRRPYIVHPHGMLETWALRSSSLSKRLAAGLYQANHLRNAACIRALCPAEMESIRAYGFRGPVCVIPNGVDLPDNGCGVPGETDMGSVVGRLKANGRKVLLYLGRIHPKKGLPGLVRGWAEVRRTDAARCGEWVLAIAGWDQHGHEKNLERLAAELGVRSADCREGDCDGSAVSGRGCELVFVGAQYGKDRARCYCDCEAFVLPSFSEGLPMAVLEAWATEKPVLITAECNLPEGFTAGAAIPIASAGSESEAATNVAAALRQLLSLSSHERAEMGRAGRALVATRFSWANVASEMKSVCAWVAGEGPKPACVLEWGRSRAGLEWARSNSR